MGILRVETIAHTGAYRFSNILVQIPGITMVAIGFRVWGL